MLCYSKHLRFKSETVLIQLLIIVFPKVTLWATEVSSWPRSFLGATGTCPNCSHSEPTRLPRVRKDVSTDLLPDNRSDQTTNCCKVNRRYFDCRFDRGRFNRESSESTECPSNFLHNNQCRPAYLTRKYCANRRLITHTTQIAIVVSL